MGDKLKTWQDTRSVSGLKETRSGYRSLLVIDVESVNQRGEHVGTDIYTCLGYRGRRNEYSVARVSPQAR